MIEAHITSAVDGRIRVRHLFLKDNGLSAAIFQFLKEHPIIENVSVNVNTGSVLLEYNETEHTQDEVIMILEEYAMSYCVENGYLEELLKYEESCMNQSSNNDGVWKLNPNQYRKLLHWGMLSSLIGTVGTILFDQENGHKIAAGAFLLFTTAHLYKNRQRF